VRARLAFSTSSIPPWRSFSTTASSIRFSRSTRKVLGLSIGSPHHIDRTSVTNGRLRVHHSDSVRGRVPDRPYGIVQAGCDHLVYWLTNRGRSWHIGGSTELAWLVVARNGIRSVGASCARAAVLVALSASGSA